MTLRKPVLNSLIVCGVPLLFAVSASAAEEGAGTAGPATEIFKWINFAIVAAVLIWVFAKKLPPVFRAKAEKIASAISKATAVKAEADRQLKDAEQRLARLDEEVRALREEARREGEAEAIRIRAMAQSDAAKIDVAAKAEIAAAERAARMELKALAATLAVASAESVLVKQLNAKTQESLIAGFVERLQGSPN
jgi:F-type H+-transporting ATPase subunit b